MNPRRIWLVLPLLLLSCDDHQIGECTDPKVRVYESNWTGVGEFLERECATCHGDGGVGGVYLEQVLWEDLSDADDANNVLVFPGDPDNSLLWQTLVWEGLAAPMPDGAQAPLAACKIDHVKEWIETGASLAP